MSDELGHSTLASPNKMHTGVTVSGAICTGKSTVSKRLGERLRWSHVSSGRIFREYCEQNNLDVLEVSKLSDQFHRECDGLLLHKMHTEGFCVFEARIAGWLARSAPSIFKVLLTARLPVRIDRYVQREHVSPEIARQQIEERDANDFRKLQGLYSVDYQDQELYNLIIDTSEMPLEAVVQCILQNIKQ